MKELGLCRFWYMFPCTTGSILDNSGFLSHSHLAVRFFVAVVLPSQQVGLPVKSGEGVGKPPLCFGGLPY